MTGTTEKFKETQRDAMMSEERYLGFYIGTKIFFEPIGLFSKFPNSRLYEDIVVPTQAEPDNIVKLERDADAF